ncbi:MAG: aspartyl/asparaginyl beta-hydroxylase domain-containing protein [Pseudomonadales bacterium]|nr:aspartyl/asparaginyl beta-hydroxylase domain-containing protein [Pseudomonadales bacterium]MBO6564413.1 aspartyl/asparaginyl beta-hydroxylase domain-containing protein [Pseudomonadales bacterium]MBO6597157.1 aspartyl/asparaginyl beta-hydroxylase domain-containing protein [Pseudomonadales bacterium]MBO6823656.1 aspartyl/asparaginyl beta-hydroxylase domain-containing protein [Pseudomonadales bacterium]
MNINDLIRDLGEVDIAEVADVVTKLSKEDWSAQKIRQNEYEVHRQTESVVMVFTDGNGWPDIEISKERGWDIMADAAMPIMHGILAEHYPSGGTIIRAMLAKLPAGNIIKPHVDQHPSFHASHRIHVPVTTNSKVRFMIDGKPHRLEVGRAYEINNQCQHSVMNKGNEDRVTLIFDYLPPGGIERSAAGT